MLLFSALLVAISPLASSAYTLQSSWKGQEIIDNFSFTQQSGGDNGGVANYLSAGDAWDRGLVKVLNVGKAVRLHVGTQKYQTPRDSIKLVSNAGYNGGLFIFDIFHMPAVCGLWPSLWATSTDGPWPDQGEIDIIEGVHETTQNAMSSHTSAGCKQQEYGFSGKFMMDSWDKNVCDAAATADRGCGVRSTSTTSYGPGFNAKRGGIYALKWDGAGIATYHFSRGSVPQDILSGNPNPSSWGTPENFLSADSCNIGERFKNQHLIINSDLCGSWAGDTWSQDMSYAGQSGSCQSKTGYNSCEEYVAAEGAAFADAYWQIHSIKIYQ